jgi:hypothetical protein
MNTYSDFQNQASSEKLGLVILEASKRLMGWVLHSGSIYKISSFNHNVIVSIEDSGTAYTPVSNIASLTAGTYYHDRTNKILYLWSSDSSHPNGLFIALTLRLHFCNAPLNAPHDLSTGYDVEWLPCLDSTSDFGVELDNQNQLGVAIEGSGTVKFFNDTTFWAPIFDKLYFENQRCFVYSYNRNLPITEAKIIYRGRVQTKKWTTKDVQFTLKDFLSEMKAPIALDDLQDIVGARIPKNLYTAKQRRLYGYVNGLRPTNIDQVLTTYPITGTVSINNGDTIIIGSGTQFLTELNGEDELTLADDNVTIQSVDSDTQVTISSEWNGTSQSGVTTEVRPKYPKRWMNREHVIAGHALTEPSTTITEVLSLSTFRVSSTTDLRPGEAIIVGGENTTIQRISQDLIKLTTTLAVLPPIGATVVRPSVTSVHLNDRELVLNRDFTYDASTGRLTLDELAEFNIAPIVGLTGSATFTNGSRVITGSGTFFKTELAIGDWIKAVGQTDYFEVLSVDADDQVTVRTSATYSATSAIQARHPEIFDDKTVILSCNVLGLSVDGTTSGTLLSKAPEIVKDILIRAGLSDAINSASFSTALNLVETRLGLAIPSKYNDTKIPTVRDTINLINRSVFGSLIQSADFELAYSVLEPDRATTSVKLDESDILKFQITSDSKKLSATVTLQYNFAEHDPNAAINTFSSITVSSDNAQYLAKTTNNYPVQTVLIDDTDATVYAQRWAFLLEVASSVMKIDSKLQCARLQINDRVQVWHEKLYERMGSNLRRKVGGIQLAHKTPKDSTIEIEDLANAFARAGAIASNTANTYDQAGDSEKLINGYITDAYGMIDNDADTFGINLIW